MGGQSDCWDWLFLWPQLCLQCWLHSVFLTSPEQHGDLEIDAQLNICVERASMLHPGVRVALQITGFGFCLPFGWGQYNNVAETELIWAHTVVCADFLVPERDCHGPGLFMPQYLDRGCSSVSLLFLDVAVLGLDLSDSRKVQSLKQALQSACGPPYASIAVWSRWLEFDWSLWCILESLSSSL